MSAALPTGWAQCTVREITDDISYGFTAKASTSPVGPRLLRITDIQDGSVHWESVPYSEIQKQKPNGYTLSSGDIVFARTGATTGKSFLIKSCPEAVFASYLIRVRPSSCVLPEFVAHFFQSAEYWTQISDNISGSAQPNCNASKLATITLPVAPLDEQRRIVAKLEMLLGKVDACRRRLAKIPRLLRRFRQSVLAAACSGRLTADWRDNQTEALEWKRTRIDDICEIIGGSQPPKKHFIYEPRDGYIRFIQIRDYKSDNHLTYIPKELARRFCSSTDVMIGRYGPPLFQILRGIEGAYNVALMKAVPKSGEQLLNDYLFTLLQDPPLRNYIINASERTVGQDGVRKDLLEEYEIELPPLPEQREIVHRVEQLFTLADQLEARFAKAQAHVDKLTQSLLAKAFRGELVPQDPNDEPASTLLARIGSGATSKENRRAKTSGLRK